MMARSDSTVVWVSNGISVARLAVLLCSAMLPGAVLINAVLAQQIDSATLPAGRGLDLIQTRCLGCHDVTLITRQRKTVDEWITTVGVMADRGAQLTPDEMQIIEDYLIQYLSSDDDR